MKILIVDDEEMIRGVLREYVEFEGNEAFEASDGMQAVKLCRENDYDLVLMDVMMPHLDGFSAVKEIKKTKDVPVIMLSARGEEYDKLFAFEIGVDDYVTKPFNPIEVTARVRSQLRRYFTLGGREQTPERIVIGGLEIDDVEKKFSLDGQEIALTPKEYEILKLLMSNSGKVFSPGEIYTLVWKESAIAGDNTVAVHIRHLREKIEIDPRNPRYIKVVWGHGYKIEEV